MTFTYPNQGTCSKMTKIELAPDHTIESIEGHQQAAQGDESRGRHRADGGHHLRPPAHQLPRPDRQEPAQGSGRAGLNKPLK